MRRILETEQKALEINLDEPIYGAFAEIGAGQEVARHFFQVGAAAGTIAKTMSAYDKTVSDEIYGPEQAGKGRYVCESRLYKMLDHEYDLMETRLRKERPDHTFFAFADTVSAINFSRTIKGDGWLGLRFQVIPGGDFNDLIVHAKLLDQDNRLQQQAIGILGVNMIYGAFRYTNEPELLIESLMDNLRGRVQLDLVRLNGADFEKVDNRLICLWMVKYKLTNVAIFGPDGNGQHAGEFLYRKSILIARGSYRPLTLVQQDMITNTFEQFVEEPDVDPDKAYFMVEITLENLLKGKENMDERDYLDRVDLLCALGHTVIVSNCIRHKDLISYFMDFKVPRIGLAMGVRKLETIMQETWEQNPDNLLGAFGEIFPRNVRFYAYPAQDDVDSTIRTSADLKIPREIHFIYAYLAENGNIVDVKKFDSTILHIYQKNVLAMLQNGQPGWEEMVPPAVVNEIKRKKLFGFMRPENRDKS